MTGKKMKIAILTAGTLPVPAVRGGAVENLIDIYLDFNNRHKLHEITVYSIHHINIEQQPAVSSDVNHYVFIDVFGFIAKIRKNIFRFTHRGLYHDYAEEYFFSQAVKILRKHTYDVIIIENRPGFALKLKPQVSAKLIYHLGNDYLNNTVKQYKAIYDSAYRIITISDYIKSRVRTINPDDHKCTTVLNGINTSMFYQAQPIDRHAMFFSPQDIIIVYSGRLTPEKGIFQLIQAMSELKDLSNLKLLVIGASVYGIDKVANSFIQQLQQTAAPIQDKVVFTGYVKYQKVPSYLKMCDIAVVPSMWEEPFGLTVVEAMAAGLPLITTNAGGIPEIGEGTAIIVDRKNLTQGLSDAIRDLYEHPDKRRKMGADALKRSNDFDKDIFAKNFFDALE